MCQLKFTSNLYVRSAKLVSQNSAGKWDSQKRQDVLQKDVLQKDKMLHSSSKTTQQVKLTKIRPEYQTGLTLIWLPEGIF